MKKRVRHRACALTKGEGGDEISVDFLFCYENRCSYGSAVIPCYIFTRGLPKNLQNTELCNAVCIF